MFLVFHYVLWVSFWEDFRGSLEFESFDVSHFAIAIALSSQPFKLGRKPFQPTLIPQACL